MIPSTWAFTGAAAPRTVATAIAFQSRTDAAGSPEPAWLWPSAKAGLAEPPSSTNATAHVAATSFLGASIRLPSESSYRTPLALADPRRLDRPPQTRSSRVVLSGHHLPGAPTASSRRDDRRPEHVVRGVRVRHAR